MNGKQHVLYQIIELMWWHAPSKIALKPQACFRQQDVVSAFVAFLRGRHKAGESGFVGNHDLRIADNAASSEYWPAPLVISTIAMATHIICTVHHASG